MTLRSIGVLASRFAGVAFSYLLIVRVGRTFSLAETGIIIFALNSVQFAASLGRLGSDIPLLRTISRWPETPVVSVVAAATRRAVLTTAIGSSMLAAAWFLWVQLDPGTSSYGDFALMPFALAMAPLSLAMVSVEIMNGRGRTEAGSFLQSGWFPMVLLLLLVLFRPGRTVEVGWLALLSAVVALAYTLPTVRVSWVTDCYDGTLPDGFGTSSAKTLATELIRILTLWIPAAALSRSAELDELGLFNAALRIAMVQNLVAVVARNILAPRYARSVGEADSKVRSEVFRVSSALGVLGALGLVVIWFGADLFLGTVGDGFDAGRDALILLSAGFAIRTVAVPSMTYLAMTHRESFVALSAGLGLISLGVGLVVFGSDSAAMSSVAIVVAFSVQLVVAGWFASRRLDGNPAAFA